MQQRKSKIILIYFLLLIIVSSISNYSINKLKLTKIKNIQISGLEQKDNEIIINKLKYLNSKNIFYISRDKVVKLLDSNSLIESYQVTKIYPSTIIINIKKTKFLAKINYGGKTFLIGSNGKLIPGEKVNNDIPYVFGKPRIEDFLKLKKILDKSKFSYNDIEKLYFYPSKRWDLKLKKNILLKLPNDYTKEILDNLYEFLKKNKVKNFTVIDSRIKNQIILNE